MWGYWVIFHDQIIALNQGHGIRVIVYFPGVHHVLYKNHGFWVNRKHTYKKGVCLNKQKFLTLFRINFDFMKVIHCSLKFYNQCVCRCYLLVMWSIVTSYSHM